MRVSIDDLGRRARLSAASLSLLFSLAAAPAYAGEQVHGKDLLQAKDVVALTLQCEDVLVQVTDDTRIYNGDERRIAFAQIPAPDHAPVLVEYTGKLAGGVVIARRLVVKYEPR